MKKIRFRIKIIYAVYRKLLQINESDLEFFVLLKGNSLQKCTVLTISCHEVIFNISVFTGSFCFHSYFGGPLDLILIVSIVTLFYISLY